MLLEHYAGAFPAWLAPVQVLGVPVSGFILNMLPYIFTVLVLVLVLKRRGGRSASPQALGLSYDREER